MVQSWNLSIDQRGFYDRIHTKVLENQEKASPDTLTTLVLAPHAVAPQGNRSLRQRPSRGFEYRVVHGLYTLIGHHLEIPQPYRGRSRAATMRDGNLMRGVGSYLPELPAFRAIAGLWLDTKADVLR